MNMDQIFSLIRGVLLSVGSVITMHGVQVFDATQWEAVVGGLLVLASVAWSQITHRA